LKLTLILPVAEVAIITIIITIPTVAIAQQDRFGISELYPSATNGTEWYSTWNNGHDRTLEFGERDDDSFEEVAKVQLELMEVLVRPVYQGTLYE
jgi:hypothetical protein